MFEAGPSNPLPRTGDAPTASQEGIPDVQPSTDQVKGRLLRKVRARGERAVADEACVVADEACASMRPALILGTTSLLNALGVAMI